jgi:hypothetical protein
MAYGVGKRGENVEHRTPNVEHRMGERRGRERRIEWGKEEGENVEHRTPNVEH